MENSNLIVNFFNVIKLGELFILSWIYDKVKLTNLAIDKREDGIL